MYGYADINGVVEHLVEHALADQLAILDARVFRNQRPCQRGGRTDPEETLEDRIGHAWHQPH